MMLRKWLFITIATLMALFVVLIVGFAALGDANAPQGMYFHPSDDNLAELVTYDMRLEQSLALQDYDSIAGSTVSWSPDGEWAAYWRYGPINPVVYVRHVDTHTEHVLRSEATVIVNTFLPFPIAWSPDSTRIAYTMPTLDTAESLHIFNVKTQTLARIPGTAQNLQTALIWTADGSKVQRYITMVFDGSQSQPSLGQTGQRGGQFHTFHLDEGVMTTFTIRPPCYLNVTWSADGNRAACVVAPGDYSNRPEVVIYERVNDGFEATVLDGVVDGLVQDLAWSPDSTRLAYDVRRDSNVDVYMLDLATHTETRITEHPREDLMRVWSSDGQSLIVRTRRGGGTAIDLYRYDLTDGRLVPLTTDGYVNDAPVYTTDGRHIAYQVGGSGVNRLYVMQADGTNKTRIPATAQNNNIGLAFNWRP